MNCLFSMENSLNRQMFVSLHIGIYLKLTRFVEYTIDELVFLMFVIDTRCARLIIGKNWLFSTYTYLFFLCFEYWFRKDNILTTLPNQHSNGFLYWESISEADVGQYICHGQNRVGYTEEIVTLELIETGSPPSIIISPKAINGRLQIPLHSYQTIECLNQDPTISTDITWRRADMVCIFILIECHI